MAHGAGQRLGWPRAGGAALRFEGLLPRALGLEVGAREGPGLRAQGRSGAVVVLLFVVCFFFVLGGAGGGGLFLCVFFLFGGGQRGCLGGFVWFGAPGGGLGGG